MSRGFKKDLQATAQAYEYGGLIDAKRRSFISQPKAIPGECDEPRPHLLLYGADKSKARIALFLRERNRCQKCQCIVVWGSDDFGWSEYGMRGEMQHVRDKPWNKCDCPKNIVLSCHRCHQGPGSEHYKRRPQWTKREAETI